MPPIKQKKGKKEPVPIRIPRRRKRKSEAQNAKQLPRKAQKSRYRKAKNASLKHVHKPKGISWESNNKQKKKMRRKMPLGKRVGERDHSQCKDKLITEELSHSQRLHKRYKRRKMGILDRGEMGKYTTPDAKKEVAEKTPTGMTSESRSRHPASICRCTARAHIIRPPPVSLLFQNTRPCHVHLSTRACELYHFPSSLLRLVELPEPPTPPMDPGPELRGLTRSL